MASLLPTESITVLLKCITGRRTILRTLLLVILHFYNTLKDYSGICITAQSGLKKMDMCRKVMIASQLNQKWWDENKAKGVNRQWEGWCARGEGEVNGFGEVKSVGETFKWYVNWKCLLICWINTWFLCSESLSVSEGSSATEMRGCRATRNSSALKSHWVNIFIGHLKFARLFLSKSPSVDLLRLKFGK